MARQTELRPRSLITWQEWKVREVETGKDLSDGIKWVKFSGASWTPDGKGFFYSRYEEPKSDSLKETNYFQKLYYHRLGTAGGFNGKTKDKETFYDRVWPGHSFKFAAALQAAQAGPEPTLIRIETKAGHGAGKPTSKVIEEIADRWAFLVRVLGLKSI